MSLVGKYDPFREAVIEPGDFIKPVAGFPQRVVSCWSGYIVDRYVQKHKPAIAGSTSTSAGPLPVYRIPYGGTEIGFYCSPVGAPAAAAIMEEVVAMGARKMMFFGACGVLERSIVEGHFIVPTAAVRDEGTSYHYLPASDEIALDPAGVAAVKGALDKIGFPYHTSKVWTTDAIYRETRKKMHERKEQGCAVVDMECAGLAAVAQFRGVSFGQFFYAEDNLDAAAWEPRNAEDFGQTHSEKYIAAAFECALALP